MHLALSALHCARLLLLFFQGLLEQKANAFMVGHVEKQPEQNVRRRSPLKVRSDTIPMMDFSF